MNRFNDPEPLRADPDGIPCIDQRGSLYIFNQKDWRTAFNVGDSTVTWATCVNPPAFNYTMGQSIQLYPDLLKAGIKMLFYSGDTDSTISITGSMKWIHQLRLDANL